MDPELLKLMNEIKADHELLKKTHKEQMQAKADGKSVAELEGKLAEINKGLDAQTAKYDQLHAALKRTQAPAPEAEAKGVEGQLRAEFKKWMKKGNPGGDGRGALSDPLRAVLEANPERKAAYLEAHPELKSLAVQDDTSGGYMVHADLTGRIVRRIFETSPIRKYASVATISTDALEGVLDFDQADAGWVAEEGTRTTTTTPKIGMWRIPTHEIYAQPAATQKLLDDAAWDPEQWLATKVADRFARKENAAFVSGTGVGQPKGFLSENVISDAANASATYDSYIADKKIGYIPTGTADNFPAVPTTSAPTAQFNPIMDLIYALKTQYREAEGTAFAMHRTMFGAVRKLQDAFGNYIWQPGFGGQPATLAGYPIAEFNDMPTLGATNKFGIAFANWKEAYQIVDRIGIRVLRDPYTAKPFVLFYTTKRTGGAVLNYEAIKLLKFATT